MLWLSSASQAGGELTRATQRHTRMKNEASFCWAQRCILTSLFAGSKMQSINTSFLVSPLNCLFLALRESRPRRVISLGRCRKKRAPFKIRPQRKFHRHIRARRGLINPKRNKICLNLNSSNYFCFTDCIASSSQYVYTPTARRPGFIHMKACKKIW